MEDEDKNSKSLVRITRVGSTPTTGIKNSFKLQLGAVFLFCRGAGPNRAGDSHQLNKRFHLRGQPFIPVVKQLAVHGYLALGDVEAGQAVGRQLIADDVFRQE